MVIQDIPNIEWVVFQKKQLSANFPISAVIFWDQFLLEYADFEGEIPKEHYGAGTVTLRDRGGLVVEDFNENEKILFELSGSKMQGRYALIKTKIGGQMRNKNWLFFKRKLGLPPS